MLLLKSAAHFAADGRKSDLAWDFIDSAWALCALGGHGPAGGNIQFAFFSPADDILWNFWRSGPFCIV